MYTVAHGVRNYLPKGEPFIGYQAAASSEAFSPMVLCRRYIPSAYEVPLTVSSSRDVTGASRLRSELQYRSLRTLSEPEARVLSAAVEQHRADLLHFHYAVDAGFFDVVRRAAKLPSLVSCYGYDVTSFPHRYLGYGAAFVRRVFEHVDVVLAMSPDMKRDIVNLGCDPAKVVVHYYGVETERFMFATRSYADREELRILIVASLQEYKGHIYLLRALRRMLDRDDGRNVRLRIVGEGPLEDALRRAVGELRLEQHVQFVGFLSRADGSLIAEFRQADVYVQPSVTARNGDKEGIPGTLVEAMASGLPAIASRHAGIPHVIEDGVTGLLVPERDVEALASSLDLLVRRASTRERLGRAAADAATNQFDCRVRHQALEQIYRSLV